MDAISPEFAQNLTAVKGTVRHKETAFPIEAMHEMFGSLLEYYRIKHNEENVIHGDKQGQTK